MPHQCRASREVHASAGKITAFHPPGGTGVRIDTAAYAEGAIPPYYDSLIAKLIVRGKDRTEAISRMSRALRCSSSKGYIQPSRCTEGFWPIRISARGTSTRHLLSDFLAKNRKQRSSVHVRSGSVRLRNQSRMISSPPPLCLFWTPPVFPNVEALFLTRARACCSWRYPLQYRNKSGNAREMLEQARELKRCLAAR